MSHNLDLISNINGGGCGSGGNSLSSASDSTTVQLPAIEVSTLITYIKEVVSPALEGRAYVHPSLINLLEDSSSQEKLRQFITDPQVKSILIRRFFRKEDEEMLDDTIESSENVLFFMTEEVNRFIGYLLVKKSPILMAVKNISGQLLYLSLDNSKILKRFSPFLANLDREDEIITFNENQVTELMKDLLQQNIDVPEINLKVHPAIRKVMIKCAGENRKATVDDFADKIGDSVFLDEVQNEVNRWNEGIKKVICLDRDLSTGTTLQEIDFWRNLKRALLGIQEKRETLQVALTLDILKKGERFHATTNFDDVGTQLQKALMKATDNNCFLEKFPINDLLSATDLDKIKFAILMIFHHMRKIRDTEYPIRRALKLMETIARDLSTQLIKVLRTQRMMDIPYEEFQKLMRTQKEIFDIWLTEYFEMKYFFTILLNKKYHHTPSYERFFCPGLELSKLQKRIEEIEILRNLHEHFALFAIELQNVSANNNSATITISTEQISKQGELSYNCSVEEVNQTYGLIKDIDPLDLSVEASDSWQTNLRRYREKFGLFEARFAAKLRDQLEKSITADEVFGIFSRYNGLTACFYEPKITAAVEDYSIKLMKLFKDGIKALYDKFKSKVNLPSDFSSATGMLVEFARIEKQLFDFITRVNDFMDCWQIIPSEDVLLISGYLIDNFRVELNTKVSFDEWLNNVQQLQLNLADRIFNIEEVKSISGEIDAFKLRVNFIPELFTLPEEVRQLKRLDFNVPLSVVNKAHQVDQLSPFATSLIQSIETYERACEKVDEQPNLIPWARGMMKYIQTILCEGVSLVWESDKLDSYVERLAQFVRRFQKKVDKLSNNNL